MTGLLFTNRDWIKQLTSHCSWVNVLSQVCQWTMSGMYPEGHSTYLSYSIFQQQHCKISKLRMKMDIWWISNYDEISKRENSGKAWITLHELTQRGSWIQTLHSFWGRLGEGCDLGLLVHIGFAWDQVWQVTWGEMSLLLAVYDALIGFYLGSWGLHIINSIKTYLL